MYFVIKIKVEHFAEFCPLIACKFPHANKHSEHCFDCYHYIRGL